MLVSIKEWLVVIFNPVMLLCIALFCVAIVFAGEAVQSFYEKPECMKGEVIVVDIFCGAIVGEQNGQECVIKKLQLYRNAIPWYDYSCS